MNETDVTLNEGDLTVDFDVVDEFLGGILHDYYFRLLFHFRVLYSQMSIGSATFH
jgi:hypothetical protein